jgi:hypothetical protein
VEKVLHINQVNGPFATRARAAEIALMDLIDLPEFVELTGVGVGDYSIYRVDREGISLRANEHLADLAVAEQNAVLQATRRLTLVFPCAPSIFMKWYDATRGEANEGEPVGISDFPLAKGFAEELRRFEGSAQHSAGPSVPSGDIVAAFRVETDKRANAKWWDYRLRDPVKYRLAEARALAGSAQRPSRWYPTLVAGWLLDREHLDRDAVLRAMRQNFPGYDVDLLG